MPLQLDEQSADKPRRSEPDSVTWLDLDVVADVTVVAAGQRLGRFPAASADPGERTIDIRFHIPTTVTRLKVICSELDQARTQEMTVWVATHRGERHHQVVRQQFNFSPNGATREVEEYVLRIEDVSAIQIRIVPSIDGRPAIARVDELKVAAVA